MGVVVSTRGITIEGGKPISVPTGEKHMVGTGIYPAHYGKTSVKVPFVARHMMWAGSSAPEPYDVQIRHETAPKAHNTKLIAHRFKTVNYRIEDEKLVCDNAPGNPESASHATPVPHGTLVVHGVKDASLAKLVLGGMTIPKEKEAARAVATAPDVDPEAPKTEEIEVVSKTQPSFIAFQVHKVLKAGGSWRLPALAEELKIDKDVLRAEIEKPESGLEILKPSGWVKVKSVSQSAI
jgi:hypothetical protein